MLKKGLFGIDLKNQVSFIALTYSVRRILKWNFWIIFCILFQALSLVGITFGFFLCLHPNSFLHETKNDNFDQLAEDRQYDQTVANTVNDLSTVDEENQTNYDDETTIEWDEDITTATNSDDYGSVHYENLVKYIKNEGIEGKTFQSYKIYHYF